MTERIVQELTDAFPKLLLPALKVTIPLTLLSFSIGLGIALLTAIVQIAKISVLRRIARFYIWIIRCTPMIVQLFVVYFGLPSIGIRLASFPAALLVFSLSVGAYCSETIRAAIESVSAGQLDAAYCSGFSFSQAMIHIIIPQAIKNILPAVANEFVTIIKESSVCYTIGVQDIMFNVKSVQSASFLIAEPLIVATFLYFCLCFPTSKLIQYVEGRMRASDKR